MINRFVSWMLLAYNIFDSNMEAASSFRKSVNFYWTTSHIP